jgi:hypothetical protein
MATVSQTGYIYISTDYGITWQEKTSAGQRNWQSVASSDDGSKIVAVVNDGYIYTSTDSGATWTEQTTPGQRYWFSVSSSFDGTKLAAIAVGGYIYTSTDSGVTWTEQTLAGSRNWQSISSSADGTKLAAVVANGYIYTSTDSGVAWTEQVASGQRDWRSVASSADGIRLVSVVNDGYIYTYGLILAPTITTNPTNIISTSSITFNHYINTEHTVYGIEYCNSGISISSCTYNNTIATSSGTSTNFVFGNYTIQVDNLIHNNYYHVRTFAENSAGRTYSNEEILLLNYQPFIQENNSGNKNWQSISSSADGTRLAAVVYGGYIYTSTDSGVTWTQRTSAGQRN